MGPYFKKHKEKALPKTFEYRLVFLSFPSPDSNIAHSASVTSVTSVFGNSSTIQLLSWLLQVLAQMSYSQPPLFENMNLPPNHISCDSPYLALFLFSSLFTRLNIL